MIFDEYNALSVTVRFRRGVDAETPTTVHYKLVNTSRGTTIVDWTEVSPDEEVTIELDAQLLVVSGASRTEDFQLVIAANKDLSTQYTKRYEFKLRNVEASS